MANFDNVVLYCAMRLIVERTDPDSEDSYRADDREGCLDTAHSIALCAAVEMRSPPW